MRVFWGSAYWVNVGKWKVDDVKHCYQRRSEDWSIGWSKGSEVSEFFFGGGGGEDGRVGDGGFWVADSCKTFGATTSEMKPTVKDGKDDVEGEK